MKSVIDILKSPVSDRLIMVLFFAFCLSLATEIHVCVIAAIVLFAAITIRRRKLTVDYSDLLLFLGMFFWFWFGGRGVVSAFACGMGFLLVYQMGKGIDGCCEVSSLELSFRTVFIISSFLLVKGLLNFSYLISHSKALVDEIWPDICGYIIPRTQHEFYLIPMASLIGFWVIVIKRWFVSAMSGILISILAIALGVYSRGRLTFFCAVCGSFLIIVAYVVEMNTNKAITMMKLAISSIGIIIVVYYLFRLNVFGVYQMYADSMWSGSGGIIHNTRFTLMADTIKMFKDYPMGGNHEILIEYDGTPTPLAHNTWIDIGKEGGIIPMLLTAGFTFSSFIWMFIVWLKESDVKKYAIIVVYVAVTIYHMVEPAIMANLLFWGVYVFIAGLLRRIYMDNASKSSVIESI